MTYPSSQSARQSTDQAVSFRTPPHSIEFEKALLGAIMLDGTCFMQIRDLIEESSFYRPAHTLIYAAMAELDNHHEPIDMVTVSEQLKRRDKLEAVGGLLYLTELAEAVPSAANIEHYARAVHEKSLLRKVISLSQEAATDSYDPSARADEVFEKFQTKFVELIRQRRGHQAVSMKTVIHDTMEYIEHIKSSEGFLTGVGSGFALMDDYTTGFSPGEFIIIAARPSMGKTSLAMNIAVAAAEKYKTPVGVFSLEMEARQLTLRLLSSEAKINLKLLRSASRIRENDSTRMVLAAGKLRDLPIYIDDSSALGIGPIRARARQLWMEHKIGLLIIDYLQLIQPPKMADNQQQWVSFVSASLKALAKELGIPVICLSQLSRAPETRGGDHRPVLSDLRDSGAIEQDADLVMFVYRPEVYEKTEDREKKKYKFGNKEYEMKGFAEIIIAKNRNGPTGAFPLAFIGDYTMFADITDDLPPQMGGGSAGGSDEDDEKPF